MDYPRRELVDNVAGKSNFCLNLVRQTKAPEWKHALVTKHPAPAVAVEIKDGSNVFPLYLYSPTGKLHANFAKKFILKMEERLGLSYGGDDYSVGATLLSPKGKGDKQGDRSVSPTMKKFGPEDVMHYIYAVFHSPSYRARYGEFLKMDFPRVPLTSDAELFWELCGKGARLVGLHLLEAAPSLITSYPETGDNEVDKVRYADKEERVYISATQYFGGVPLSVWDFHVGGYRVCEKWLKDRRGRKLTLDDINHYQKIVASLSETIEIMSGIDSVISSHGGFPLR